MDFKTYHISANFLGENLMLDPIDVGAYLGDGNFLNDLQEVAHTIITAKRPADIVVKVENSENGLKGVEAVAVFSTSFRNARNNLQ